MKPLLAALATATLLSGAGAAFAQEINPAVVYDRGGRTDRSFNEAAFVGATRYSEETGTEFRDFEIQDDAQREQALRRFARDGHTPIIAIGFGHQAALEAVAPEFPDIDFAIVDSVVDLPNVRSILFKEEEGSYLVGLLAALQSESGTVGFVGGMDVPLIRKFACGYKGGVLATREDATVIENMTGTTGAAWNDPVRGAELARSQMDQGADIVFHAAGGTGIGVLQAVADAGHYGIGVDSNQNALHPGNVLTSMIKRVDNAVVAAFEDAAAGEWTAGIVTYGLAEDGVGYALDENNEALVTAEMRTAVDEARQGIIDGTITVHDFMSDGACPY